MVTLFTILKSIQGVRGFSSDWMVDKINELGDRYNLPKIVDYNTNYRSDHEEWLFAAYNNENLFSLNDIFYKSEQGKHTSIRYENNLFLFLQDMFCMNEEIVNSSKRMQDISGDYARSFETKKNIPLHIQKKMKENKFLDWFGYVEFDELTDMSKIEQIESEFAEFATFMRLPVSKDYSLRFRRLGQHKAAGLHYPSERCISIDLQGLSSMVHELMHKIDATTLPYSNLSDLYNFRTVIDRYKQIVSDKVASLPKDNPVRISFFGNSKYNKDYYFTHTEIFARLGELYVKKILGIESSIVGACTSIYYPDDEKLLDMVKKYYQSLFGEIGEKEEKKMAASPKSVMSDFMLPTGSDNVQKLELTILDDGQLQLVF